MEPTPPLTKTQKEAAEEWREFAKWMSTVQFVHPNGTMHSADGEIMHSVNPSGAYKWRIEGLEGDVLTLSYFAEPDRKLRIKVSPNREFHRRAFDDKPFNDVRLQIQPVDYTKFTKAILSR